MNKAAVKDYALECSKTIKAGRFTRMGADFMEELEADFEAVIRGIDVKVSLNWPEVKGDGRPLLDLEDRNKLYDVFSRLLARLTQRKVEMQPSCGHTLGRTR